jgi:hypothetical protein
LLKRIADENNFYSVSLDVFETKTGKFVINEIQSIIGQATKHLMIIDNNQADLFSKLENLFLKKDHLINIAAIC